MKKVFRLNIPLLYALAFLAVAIVALALIDRPTKVAAATSACRVVLALDNSNSVGDDWQAYKDQLISLFQDPELRQKQPDLELAFWTFSHFDSTTDFNKSHHPFVSLVDSTGISSFESRLNATPLSGSYTNYTQAFGYNPTNMFAGGGQYNFTLQPNSMPDLRMISGTESNPSSRPDVMVLLTDGAPNKPTTDPSIEADDGNNAAIDAAYQARQLYPDTNFIAGFINANPSKLNDVRSWLTRSINGPTGDPSDPDVGPIVVNEGGGTQLSEFLVSRIPENCDTPQVTPAHSLVPTVTPKLSVITPGQTPTFDYYVENIRDDPGDNSSEWSLFDIVLEPNITDPNPFGCSGTYCDNMQTCDNMRARIAAAAADFRCRQSTNNNDFGSTPFQKGMTGLGTTANEASRAADISGVDMNALAPGARVCRVLQLKNPAPGAARYRIHGACAIVGEVPLVEIRGGDAQVGRYFQDDTASINNTSGIYTSKFRLSGTDAPNGRTFGSWVEYGVLAPGTIKTVASLSGYVNGKDLGEVPACDIRTNQLTFSNTAADESGSATPHADECGHYMGGSKYLPDIATALTRQEPIDNTGNAVYNPLDLRLNGDSREGLYEAANFTINSSTIANSATQKGKTYVVYAPSGTVTISENITQAGDSYDEPSQIPQLVIIARNIIIQDDVTRVDAWLIAQGTQDDHGVVNTCVVGNTTPSLSSRICDKQLTINGPIIARELRLWRTTVYGDPCRLDSPSACGLSDDRGTAKRVDDPAEIMNLPGSSLLWALAHGTPSGYAQTTYTTELPPLY